MPQILGRTLNFVKLLSQSMNQFLRTNLDIIIRKYESGSLSSIMELDSLLSVLQLTHSLLAEYLTLDPWEDIMIDIDDQLVLTHFSGRILTHTLVEILDDFIPNYCYNSVTQRFLRGPQTFVDPYPRQKAPKVSPVMMYGSKDTNFAYSMIVQAYATFVDNNHFRVLVRLVGQHGLAVIVGELTNHMNHIVEKMFSNYGGWFKQTFNKFVGIPILPSGVIGESSILFFFIARKIAQTERVCRLRSL